MCCCCSRFVCAELCVRPGARYWTTPTSHQHFHACVGTSIAQHSQPHTHVACGCCCGRGCGCVAKCESECEKRSHVRRPHDPAAPPRRRWGRVGLTDTIGKPCTHLTCTNRCEHTHNAHLHETFSLVHWIRNLFDHHYNMCEPSICVSILWVPCVVLVDNIHAYVYIFECVLINKTHRPLFIDSLHCIFLSHQFAWWYR